MLRLSFQWDVAHGVKTMRRGTKHSEETKRKIGEASKGRPRSWTGHSEETKRKLRDIQKGKKHSEETKQKLRQINLGKKHSEETKKKLRGIFKVFSEEHKKKLRDARKGKKLSLEARLKISGEKSPGWKGGKSFGHYGFGFNKALREIVRNIGRRKCQICKKTEIEESKKLSVHHIDYNKKNNNLHNLIALCMSCHSKTNDNRNYWINYFNNMNMEQDDIDRYDDGAVYPELTEEEQLALEDNEFTTQPQIKVLRNDMESITTEADKLKELLSK